MFSTKFLIVLVTLVVGFVGVAHSLHCYVCSSEDHPSCKDPFKGSDAEQDHLLKDCNSLPAASQRDPETNQLVTIPYSFCRKTTQKAALSGMKEQNTRIIRTCGFLNDTRFNPEGGDPNALRCYRRVGTFEVELLYCGCFGNKCNPAGVIKPGFGVVFLALIGSVLGFLGYY